MVKQTIDWDAIKPIPGFDAVRMKNEIQARIYEDTKDISPEAEREYRRKRRERFAHSIAEIRLKKAAEEGGD